MSDELDSLVKMPPRYSKTDRNPLVRHFLDEYNNENTGLYKIPLHQRGESWDDEDKARFLIGIYTEENRQFNTKIIGQISCYQLIDKNGILKDRNTIWINDGQQRIRTLYKFKTESEYIYKIMKRIGGSSFKYSLDDIYNDIMNFSIRIVVDAYFDGISAAKDYRGLNSGEPQTPYEFYKSIYVAGNPKYELCKNILDDYENRFLCILIGKDYITKSESRIKRSKDKSYQTWKRYAISWLYRELSGIWKDDPSYIKSITKRNLSKSDIINNDSMEIHFRKILDICDVNRISNACDKIINEISDFEQDILRSKIVVNKYLKEKIDTISYVNKSFYYIIRKYHKTIKTPIEKQEKIIQDHIKRTLGISGSGIWINNNTMLEIKAPNESFTIGTVKKYTKFVLGDIEKRENNFNIKANKSKNGDYSHLKPFSKYGNGESILENKSNNRSRGGRIMTEEEIEIAKLYHEEVRKTSNE